MHPQVAAKAPTDACTPQLLCTSQLLWEATCRRPGLPRCLVHTAGRGQGPSYMRVHAAASVHVAALVGDDLSATGTSPLLGAHRRSRPRPLLQALARRRFFGRRSSCRRRPVGDRDFSVAWCTPRVAAKGPPTGACTPQLLCTSQLLWEATCRRTGLLRCLVHTACRGQGPSYRRLHAAACVHVAALVGGDLSATGSSPLLGAHRGSRPRPLLQTLARRSLCARRSL